MEEINQESNIYGDDPPGAEPGAHDLDQARAPFSKPEEAEEGDSPEPEPTPEPPEEPSY